MWYNVKIGKLLLMKCIGIALFMLLCIAPVFSQIRVEPKPPKKASVEEEKAREQTRWMYKNLTLEAEQYEKINEINLTYAFQSDSLDNVRSKAARNDGKAKIKLVKEEQIKSVLTPEQYKLYVAHKEKQTSQKKSPFSGTYFGK
jgi:hypothetical protein